MPFAQSAQFMFQICIVDTRVEDLLTVSDEKISQYLMMFMFCESVFYTLCVCELLYVHMFAVKVPISAHVQSRGSVATQTTCSIFSLVLIVNQVVAATSLLQ